MLLAGLWKKKDSFCKYGISLRKTINTLYQLLKVNLADPRPLKLFASHKHKQMLIMINTNEEKLRKGAHNKAWSKLREGKKATSPLTHDLYLQWLCRFINA